jgi:hypothetical protein
MPETMESTHQLSLTNYFLHSACSFYVHILLLVFMLLKRLQEITQCICINKIHTPICTYFFLNMYLIYRINLI